MALRKLYWSIALSLTPLLSTATFATDQVTPKAGYFPLIIKNETNNPNIHDIYMIALADQGKTPCAMSFSQQRVGSNMAEVGSCINISKIMNTQDFSYSLTKLPSYDPATQSVLLYIPQVISGRAYISLNYKLTFPVVAQKGGGYAFQTPNMNNKQDANYNILFDKFEYTYDDKQTFWINPTAVDFFAMPITLMPFDQQKPSGAPSGQTRNDLLTTITDSINRHDESADKYWSKVIIKDISGRTNTVLRVAAPYVAPDFPVATYLAQPNNSYIAQLIDFYKTHSIAVDCSELAGNKHAPINTFYDGDKDSALYLFTGKIELDNGVPTFVFTNNPAGTKYSNKPYPPVKIPLNDTAAVSTGFFMPGQEPFTTVNYSVKSVIVKNLTAAFSAGLLPADNRATLDNSFFASHRANYYRANPLIKNTGGPWYDLYAKGIHAAIPITYAYAYDDVLGQDGTLNSQNNAEPITVILGDMSGTQIPAPYTPPPPKHIQPVTGIANSGFTCSGESCTLKATWKVPANQAENVSYFILPQQFKNTSPTKIIQQQGSLIAGSATHGSIQLSQDEVLNPGTKVQVFTCLKDSSDFTCPSSKNSYQYNKAIGSQPF